MRVIVASRSFSRHPILRTEMLARYPDAVFNDSGATLANDSLVEFLDGYDAAVIALEKIHDGILAALPHLKVISKFGVGYDNLDLKAIAARGVRLGWAGGLNKRSVSELALCFMIALLRHVPECNRQITEGRWQLKPGRQLSGRTVGLIGCGHVGKDLAVLLRALGCRVLAFDIRDYSAFYHESGVEPVDLKTLLASSDIVSLHVPLNESTRGMISADQIATLKSDALLINVARGGLVDENALKAALMAGRLAGAGFDVFSSEPPADLELLRLPNFLSSPHMGGSTEEGILAMGRQAIRGLAENRIPEEGIFPA